MSEYIVHEGIESTFTDYLGVKHTVNHYEKREEIVRCRDCRHFRIEPWDEVLAAQYGAPPMICERTGDMDDVEPDGFCSWAERREQ